MTYREEQFMKQMTEIAIEVAELRAENKLLKSFNDSLLQALHKPVVVRPASESASDGELLATEARDTNAAREIVDKALSEISNDDFVKAAERYFGGGVRKSSDGHL